MTNCNDPSDLLPLLASHPLSGRMEVTSHEALRLIYSLEFEQVRATGPFFSFENAHAHVKCNQQEQHSLYVFNEYTSIESLSAVEFIVSSITQPEK